MADSAHSARLAILADDLTGALDCAVAFASNGFGTVVSLSSFDVLPDHDVVSINMNTRGYSVEVARNEIYVQTLRRQAAAQDVTYIKIDSTLRGHPGVEIGTALAASSASVALMCPAFPATGRTVRHGQLSVHGELLTDTEVGNDLLNPVRSSSVEEILAEHSQLPIRSIDLDDVRSGRLLDRLNELTSKTDGPFIVLCDAESDSDLDAIAKAGLSFEASVNSGSQHRRRGAIFAGSAGLASALARGIDNIGTANTLEQPEFRDPVLLVTASQRTLANEQIDALVAANGVEKHEIEIEVASDGLVRPASLDRDSISASLVAGTSIALRAVASGDLASLSPQAIRKAADSITQQLGQVVASLASQHWFGGLVIIGGDTAYGVLSAIEARGIVLASEPLPGVPVGTIAGGALDGVPIVTKAGAFGDQNTLVDLFFRVGQPSIQSPEESD